MVIGLLVGGLIPLDPVLDLTPTENAAVVVLNLPQALDLDPVGTSPMIKRRDPKKRKAAIIKMKIKKESPDLLQEAKDRRKKKSNKNE